MEDKKLGYFGDVWRSLDLLLCMHAYWDLQYGPKRVKNAPELRRRVKLGWIAYSMNAAQKLLNQWDRLEEELWKWYEDEGNQYRNKETFKDSIDFLHGYIQTTIAELADITLFNIRFQSPLHFIVPRFLSLVEINKYKHFNEEKYFFVSNLIAIRLVLYKPTNPSVDDFLTVSLEPLRKKNIVMRYYG